MNPIDAAAALGMGALFYLIIWSNLGKPAHSIPAMVLSLVGGTLLIGEGGPGWVKPLGVATLVLAVVAFVRRDGWEASLAAGNTAPPPAPPRKDP